MIKFDDIPLLQLIETYAEAYDRLGYIIDESHLSMEFDEHVMPLVIEQYGRKGHEFDDEPAISEAFSNYMDALHEEGRLHELQVQSYSYVGEWS